MCIRDRYYLAQQLISQARNSTFVRFPESHWWGDQHDFHQRDNNLSFSRYLHGNSGTEMGWVVTLVSLMFLDPIRQNKTSVTNGLRASGFAVCYVCSRRGLSSLSSKWTVATNDQILSIRFDPDGVHWRLLSLQWDSAEPKSKGWILAANRCAWRPRHQRPESLLRCCLPG